MPYNDTTGFFSLLGLFVQCGLAWLLAGLFAVLCRQGKGAAWFRHWLWAMAAFAVGLTAVSVRFVLSYGMVPGTLLYEEGSTITRALYGSYQCGKCLFAWLLYCGTAQLCNRRTPRVFGPVGIGVVGYALLTGLTVHTVDPLFLFQAPLLIWSCFRSWSLLQPLQRERRDAGSRILGTALFAWGLLGSVYAISVAWLLWGGPALLGLAGSIMRVNPYLDLTLEFVLGMGMIVLVLEDAQHGTALAAAERDRLRSELARDEKLRAIGTLVSGVAHELNNPLTAVLGFADDLDAEDRATRRAAAQVVREQAERCRAIVQSLSALAGQVAHRFERLPIEEVVARVARGFAPQLAAAGLGLAKTCEPGLPAVLGDAVGIEQILTNLISNAAHASPRGATVHVTARCVGETVEIAVRDEGAGVPAEIAGRLFEPFFTTKARGQGTGLGLPLARAMARAHHGDLLCRERSPGTGAEFVLRIPADRTPSDAALDDRTVGEPRKGLRLLVVDDESLVRQVLVRNAQRRTWITETADSGEAAWALLSQGPIRYDAVVCDLIMPGLTGFQLYERLGRERPDLLPRFVFVTGDLASAEAAEFVRRCRCPVVGKPFDLDRLMRVVERVATSASA